MITFILLPSKSISTISTVGRLNEICTNFQVVKFVKYFNRISQKFLVSHVRFSHKVGVEVTSEIYLNRNLGEEKIVRKKPWYLYKMVAQNMLRTPDVK